MFKKIVKAIKKPRLVLLRLLDFNFFRILSDKSYLKIKYRLMMRKKLDLKNPKTFNEKIQRLKLYDRNPLYTNLVDKILVRDYIKEKIGEEYLIPIIGTYNNFDEIDFSKLPNQFVLKPNHTSGNVFICKNKDKIDYKKLKKTVKSWMKREYYWYHREWPYKHIVPKLLIEKFMVEENDQELRDYKFLCFNGEPKIIQVMSNRIKTSYNINHYDLEWNEIDYLTRDLHTKNLNGFDKPKNLDKMIKIAKILSNNTYFVRIDLYNIAGKIFFGEFTLYPASGYMGFCNEESDILLGELLNI